MPLAVKKNQRTERVTPAQLDAEPEIASDREEPPQAPKVTALISSYNNASGLRRCLAALEASSMRAAMEILVVDKGSQDESPGLDAEFPEATFLRLPRNFGSTKALNIGMRTGVGEYVFFLNPEIEVAPGTVASLVEYLESGNDSVAVCPLIVDENGKPVEQAYRLPTPQTGIDLAPVALGSNGDSIPVEYATFQALLARKYFIRGINYFDERFGEFGADAELCFQIKRAGRQVTVLPRQKVLRQESRPDHSPAAETLLQADRVHGCAVYFSKHYGIAAGLALRLKESLKALAGMRLALFSAVVTGTKVDGSQSANL